MQGRRRGRSDQTTSGRDGTCGPGATNLNSPRENWEKDAKTKVALVLTVRGRLHTFPATERGQPRSGTVRLRPLPTATHPGARFPGEWQESPERAEASAKAFSGFLRVSRSRGARLFSATDRPPGHCDRSSQVPEAVGLPRRGRIAQWPVRGTESTYHSHGAEEDRRSQPWPVAGPTRGRSRQDHHDHGDQPPQGHVVGQLRVAGHRTVEQPGSNAGGGK